MHNIKQACLIMRNNLKICNNNRHEHLSTWVLYLLILYIWNNLCRKMLLLTHLRLNTFVNEKLQASEAAGLLTLFYA